VLVSDLPSSSLLTVTVLRSSSRVHLNLTNGVQLSRMLFEGVTVHIRHPAHFTDGSALQMDEETLSIRRPLLSDKGSRLSTVYAVDGSAHGSTMLKRESNARTTFTWLVTPPDNPGWRPGLPARFSTRLLSIFAGEA
jgi:hypothetical protein